MGMCGPRKHPYSHKEEMPRGKGVSKAKSFTDKRKYEAMLEFPEVGREFRQKCPL